MKVIVVRGAFLNPFEGQSFEPLINKINIIAIASKKPIGAVNMSTQTFWSPYDVVRVLRSNFLKKCYIAMLNRTLGDPHFLYGLEDFVTNQAPIDIAHIAETYYGYDMQIVALKKMGLIKKIVSTCWETMPGNNESVYKKKAIKLQVIPNIDRFICPTVRARNALLAEGVDEMKITIVPIGVDRNRFKEKARKNCDGFVRILFVGRFVKEKGIHDVIVLMRSLKNLPIFWNFIGDGPLKNIIKNELKNVRGNIQQSSYINIHRHYNNSDIMIVPSKTCATWEEQYGMVIIEGMSCGLPIVAYDSGAISDVLGDAGITIAEGDIAHFTRVLKQMIVDKDLRTNLSIKSKKRSVSFDNNRTASVLFDIYNTLRR